MESITPYTHLSSEPGAFMQSIDASFSIADIIEASNTAIMVAKVDGDNLVTVYTNTQNAKLTGYEVDELIGTKPTEMTVSPDTDMASMNKAIQSAKSGEPGIFASLFRRKDGTPFAVRCQVTAIFDECGEVTHYTFIATPIDPGNPGLRWFGRQGLLAQAERVNGSGAWRYDFSTGEIHCSDNFYALMGISQDQDNIQSILNLFAQDERDRIESAILQCAKDHKSFDMHCVFYREDGTRRYGAISAQPEFHPDGRVTGIIGILRDETEMHELRTKQDMYMRAADVGFLEVDIENEVLHYSAVAARIIGQDGAPGSMPVDEWKSRVHPDDFEQAWQSFTKHKNDSNVATRRYRFLREDDTYAWVEVKAAARRDPGKSEAKIYSTIIDIDAQMRHKESLESLSTRLKLAVNAAQLGLWSWDLKKEPQNEAMSWSTRFCSILGFDNDTPANWETFEQSIHPDDKDRVRNAILMATEKSSENSFHIEHKCIRPDGRVIWVENHGLAQHDEAGRVISISAAIHDITDRKKTELKIIKSEKRFNDVVAITGECIFEMDAQGRFTYLSDAALDIYGYESHEMLGHTPIEYAPSDDRNPEEWLQSAIKNDGWKDLEREIKRKDGSSGWILINGRNLISIDGTFYGFRGAIRDITTRHNAFEELSQSEARFTDVTKATRECIFELDADCKITYVSQRFKNIFGIEPDAVIGRSPYEILKDPKVDFETWVRQARAAGGWTDYQHSFDHPNGGEAWVNVNGRAFYDEHGAIAGFRGSVRDITVSKLDQLRLIESERRTSDVVHSAGGCVFDLDSAGNITYVSDSVKTLLAYEPDDLIGQPTYILAPDLKPRHQEWLAAIRHSDGGLESEFRVDRLDGSKTLWTRTYCRVLTDDTGNITGYRGILFDITAHKEAQLSIIKARKEAEAAAEERARFLSTMSHEIRTPLNAMIGMTDELLLLPQDDQQRRLTISANKAGHHLLSLINDILDYSKLDAGKLVVETIPFSLKDEVNSVVDMLHASAEDKGLTIKTSISSKVSPVLKGDPGRLRQILVNLTGNAIKFTQEGAITITVTAKKDNIIKIAVKDSGCGISEEAQARLFKDFSQADASTTRKYGGTGLGLAICKRLTDIMKGRIGVQSTPGKGSTFWFELPLPAASALESKALTQSEETAAPSMPALRILVAEDNPANQLLIRTMLERMGQNITVVDNGADAVSATEKAAFDLIFMDVQMPQMDGITATRTLRRAGCNTPIVALTAHVLADEAPKFKAAGMDDWLSKPLDARKLVESIVYWAQNPRGNEPADSQSA